MKLIVIFTAIKETEMIHSNFHNGNWWWWHNNVIIA